MNTKDLTHKEELVIKVKELILTLRSSNLPTLLECKYIWDIIYYSYTKDQMAQYARLEKERLLRDVVLPELYNLVEDVVKGKLKQSSGILQPFNLQKALSYYPEHFLVRLDNQSSHKVLYR